MGHRERSARRPVRMLAGGGGDGPLQAAGPVPCSHPDSRPMLAKPPWGLRVVRASVACNHDPGHAANQRRIVRLPHRYTAAGVVAVPPWQVLLVMHQAARICWICWSPGSPAEAESLRSPDAVLVFCLRGTRCSGRSREGRLAGCLRRSWPHPVVRIGPAHGQARAYCGVIGETCGADAAAAAAHQGSEYRLNAALPSRAPSAAWQTLSASGSAPASGGRGKREEHLAVEPQSRSNRRICTPQALISAVMVADLMD